jgi:diguanylate cyclase (GGDEF)-like protein/PAS domain S-box-containing protein
MKRELPRILVVDDEPDMCWALENILRHASYAVTTATSGAEAIEKAQGRFFNLALLDIRLSDMEGIELVAPLKEMHPDIEVMMITGYASLESAVQALNGGASAYLTKPLKIDEVLATVREALEKQRLVQEKQRAEEALRESEARYRAIVEDQTELICRFLPHGTLTFVNEAYCRYFGKKRDELIGSSFMPLIPEEDQKFVEEQIISLSLENPVATYEHRVILPDGRIRWQQCTDRAIFDEQGRFIEFQSVGRDITERVQAEEQLVYIATHDPLTGLPNRRLFNDRLTLELAHTQRNRQKLVVMLLDLDHFKNVNDTLGHSMGDKLLQVVGHRLTSLVRKGDTVARMGGDEFMLVLPEMAWGEDVGKAAQKILGAFREPFVFDGHELRITTSIGIAIYPDDGEDADTLMRNADIAMYRAKERGRDNYQRYSGKGGRDGREREPFGRTSASSDFGETSSSSVETLSRAIEPLRTPYPGR